MAIQFVKYNLRRTVAEIAPRAPFLRQTRWCKLRFTLSEKYFMRPAQKKSVLVTAVLAVLLCSVALVFTRVRSRSSKATGSVSAAHNNELPRVILWAWERPTDLHFIDPRQVGVAFLAQTVLLRGVNDDVETLEALMRALVEARVKPYYLHHLDKAQGTSASR